MVPVLPSHVINPADAIRGRHDDHAIGGVVHRSLHHEKLPGALQQEQIPLLIPSDKPNLHRIPDGVKLLLFLKWFRWECSGGEK